MRPVERDPALQQRFGATVRGLRRARGLSQRDLAQKAGLSYVYLNHLERGYRSPSLQAVIRIAEGLELRPSTLVRRVAS